MLPTFFILCLIVNVITVMLAFLLYVLLKKIINYFQLLKVVYVPN